MVIVVIKMLISQLLRDVFSCKHNISHIFCFFLSFLSRFSTLGLLDFLQIQLSLIVLFNQYNSCVSSVDQTHGYTSRPSVSIVSFSKEVKPESAIYGKKAERDGHILDRPRAGEGPQWGTVALYFFWFSVKTLSFSRCNPPERFVFLLFTILFRFCFNCRVEKLTEIYQLMKIICCTNLVHVTTHVLPIICQIVWKRSICSSCLIV